MAIQRTDFILNKNGDFPLQDTVVNGVYLDTPFGNSDQQHIADGIFYDLGDLKQSPTYGFGAYNYLNAEYDQSIESKLKQMLAKDGYIVSPGTVSPVSGGGFLINAKEKIYRR
jgi:hypothetical protein